MKKALKITGITLASLIGLVLIVVGIAVAIVTSSGRLTKMVKHYAPQFVNCKMELDRANLTLFKTFPNVGVGIEHVLSSTRWKARLPTPWPTSMT